jgi:hypothetical protein
MVAVGDDERLRRNVGTIIMTILPESLVSTTTISSYAVWYWSS